MGDVLVRTLKDTSALEVATIALQASFFAKATIEEAEGRKHDILKRQHATLFSSFNQLYIENSQLKKKIAKRDVASEVIT